MLLLQEGTVQLLLYKLIIGHLERTGVNEKQSLTEHLHEVSL